MSANPSGGHPRLPRLFLDVGDRLLVAFDFLLRTVQIADRLLPLRRDVVTLRRRLAGGEFAVEAVDLALQRGREGFGLGEGIALSLDSIAPRRLVFGRVRWLGFVTADGEGSAAAVAGVVATGVEAAGAETPSGRRSCRPSRMPSRSFAWLRCPWQRYRATAENRPQGNREKTARTHHPTARSRERCVHDQILGPAHVIVKTTVTTTLP
jgi:hypothetical protein